MRPPGSDPDRPFVIAVNVELEESGLARLDPEELVAQITSPSVGPQAGPEFADGTDLRREDQERRQSWWRWLLIAAFVLFVTETLISNWVSRKGSVGLAAG